MVSFHNIEKSAFRPNEYVGYGGGQVWRLVRSAPYWRMYGDKGGWCIARSLKQASLILGNWETR